MILQTSPSTNRRSPKAFLAPPLLAFLNQQGSRQAGLCTTSRFVLRSYLWHKWYPINEYEFVEEKGIVEKKALLKNVVYSSSYIIIISCIYIYMYNYIHLFKIIQRSSDSHVKSIINCINTFHIAHFWTAQDFLKISPNNSSPPGSHSKSQGLTSP